MTWRNSRPDACLRCETGTRYGSSLWCAACIAEGKRISSDSFRRQIAAGAPIDESGRIRNWKKGDPLWWVASGCYNYRKKD